MYKYGYLIGLIFPFCHFYLIEGRYTLMDLILPIACFLFITIKVNALHKTDFILAVLLFIYPVLHGLISPSDLKTVVSGAQNSIIFLSIAISSRINNVFIDEKGLILLFFYFNLVALFHLNFISGNNIYEMYESRPFFDSVDKSYFFLLILAVLLTRSSIYLKNCRLFYIITICSTLVNIFQSSNRLSIFIVLILIIFKLFRRKKTILILSCFSLFTLSILNFNDTISFLSSNGLISDKVYTFLNLLTQSGIDSVLLDSSFTVRIRNFEYLFERMNFLELIKGYGNEAWRNYLPYENKSIDNSLIAYYFTYGLLGSALYVYILKLVQKKVGLLLTIAVLFFSGMQDTFGNFLYSSNLILIMILFSKR